MSNKKYGLIVPGKDKPLDPPKANFIKSSVFGSESSNDSDDNNGPSSQLLGKIKAVPIGPGLTERRQARILQEKALAEDPTIFQYDELYDDIENKRDEEKKLKKNDIKKPKYINRLLQQAERRKLENERRIERTVQKEREAEGEQYKDKETYVTTAYKKKLEELKQAEELEKREDYLESIGDVRKQKDLDGFYRHIYEQKLGGGGRNKIENINSTISISTADIKFEDNDDDDDDDKKNQCKIEKSPKNIKNIVSKSRTYRKRHNSDDDNNETNEISIEKDINNSTTTITKKSHIQSNLDADSDFSIDSTTDSDDNDDNNDNNNKKSELIEKNDENKDKQKQINHNIKIEPIVTTENCNNENNNNNNIKNDIIIKIKEEKKIICDDEEQQSKEIKKPKKPKIDIWKKRTVGDIFDAALQRYFERKSARNA